MAKVSSFRSISPTHARRSEPFASIQNFWLRRKATIPTKKKQQFAEELRQVVATGAKRAATGEHVRCVVSVSMLTEGWDANNVTHILGVRAFGSQLLCEQVVGRGLCASVRPDPTTGLLTEDMSMCTGIPFSVIPFKGRPVDGIRTGGQTKEPCSHLCGAQAHGNSVPGSRRLCLCIDQEFDPMSMWTPARAPSDRAKLGNPSRHLCGQRSAIRKAVHRKPLPSSSSNKIARNTSKTISRPLSSKSRG